ncbi:MAG: DUF3592 domain-containing protein [Candidatus Avelusimicrobium sp.]|uniref:DUF3592 domain-containing protein n=1 Tax=Candidatus Avelusimicrobium sp. TaxID=3048833 RepID=UPI003F03C513
METILSIGIFAVPAAFLVCGAICYLLSHKSDAFVNGAIGCFVCAFISSFFAVKKILEVAPAEFAGVILGAVGGVAVYREKRFFKRAIIVNGVVTSYASKEIKTNAAYSSAQTVYAPVVKFEFDGEERYITGRSFSATKPKTGTVMQVGIDPRNIYDARLYSKAGYGVASALLWLGIILLVSSSAMRLTGKY